jgi:hypothetical protein
MVWSEASVGTSRAVGDCLPNSMALAGEFSPLIGSPNGVMVLGLAPNGNATVRLTLGDGSSETSTVSSQNLYVVTAAQAIRHVTLRDSSGTLRTWNVPDGAP